MYKLVTGKQYRITCENFSASMYAPKTVEYEGTVLPSSKYDPPNTFRLSTNIQIFPSRIINYDRVISVDGASVDFKRSAPIVKVVTGSKGDKYVVTTIDGNTTCTCPGFQFRHKCKHVEKGA